MKRLTEIGAACIVVLVLSGCFPSQHIYRVEECDEEPGGLPRCGMFEIGSEFAFVKETNNGDWRLWHKFPDGGDLDEVCIGTIDGDEFSCDRCGPEPEDIFTITKLSSSDCNLDLSHCVRFVQEGTDCPDGGSGKAGHN